MIRKKMRSGNFLNKGCGLPDADIFHITKRGAIEKVTICIKNFKRDN